MDEGTETYILLLLADGNLPTGSFVASSGLESYVKHGFFPPHTRGSQILANEATIDFVRNNLRNYSRSALPFVSDAHIAVSDFKAYIEESKHSSTTAEEIPRRLESKMRVLRKIIALDSLYEVSTLNQVTLRASKAQGVAQLSLFSKGFSKPALSTSSLLQHSSDSISCQPHSTDVDGIGELVDEYKRLIRRGESQGHLPVCWGILTAGLGLSLGIYILFLAFIDSSWLKILERSQYLHLFLQARSLISASVRLNTIGPYAAQQLLFHVVRRFVDEELSRCKDLRTGLQASDDDNDGEITDYANGAATTWPIGEILAARHDLLHSRVFNS